MESLQEHNEDSYRNVHDALAPADLLELTTIAAEFPDIALQEFWATFDLDEHKRRRGQKVITFFLGGEAAHLR